MPLVTVNLPAALTSPQPALTTECEAATVRDALRAVVAAAPQFEQRVFYGTRLLVTVHLNGRHLAPAEAAGTALETGDRLDVMPPVAGG